MNYLYYYMYELPTKTNIFKKIWSNLNSYAQIKCDHIKL